MRNDVERHNPRVTVEPLTKEKFMEFYGLPSVPNTIRGYAFYLDGILSGVGGVQYGSGHFTAFSDIKKVSVSKATLYRCGKMIIDMIDSMGIDVTCIAGAVTAPVILSHLGFEFYTEKDDGLYYKRERK